MRLGADSAPSHHLSVIARTDLPIRAPYRFGGSAPRDLSPCVPPSLITARQRDRNTNRLSITYAFRPRLRPASPAVDQHGCGTLGHPVGGIRTLLALLMPTFALPAAPGSLPLPLRRRPGRSPTIGSPPIRGVGAVLEPRWIVGAAARSTSELLRTLSRVAASKPTSWLSVRRDHLAHLGRTWGP